MVNAQEWMDKNYPKEKRKEFNKLDTKNVKLEGKMIIKDWPNLEKIYCKNNDLAEIEIIDLPMLDLFLVECCQLTSVKIENCPVIRDFDVKENCLTDLSFLEELNPEKLAWLNVQGNNFPEQDLSFASKFINLERLMIKNRYDEDKFKKEIYNHFSGSLEPLKDLKKLKWLNISNTNIDSGLEYLADSVRKINCWDDWKQAGCSRIRRELETAARIEGVTEKLQEGEEGDPDQVKFSDRYYRLAPWRQVQDLLLEKRPFVQQLNQKLATNEKVISELKEELKKKESEHDELKRQLDLVVREEKDKEMREKDEKIKKLEEQVEVLIARNNLPITISPNFSYFASFSNQLTYQIQYNDELLKKELGNIKQKYRELEAAEKQNESQTDQQKLKKTILFLGAKRIFAANRQRTIESLIETYEEWGKSVKRYDRIATVGDYISTAGDIASIFPPAGVPVKLLGQGIPIITNLLKDHSLANHAKKFGDYLLTDEKSLALLQETYQSLNKSLSGGQSKMNSVLVELFKLSQNQFSQYSVFVVGEIPKESTDLNAENMKKAIETLDKHFAEFYKELQQEAIQNAERMEEIFAGEEGKLLQTEIAELLEELSGNKKSISSVTTQQADLQEKINGKQVHLRGLIESAKGKLKSRSTFSETKQKEREEKLDPLFKNIPVTYEKFIRELETIKQRWKERITEQEIRDIWQIDNELRRLQVELESLQGQQSQQIELPPKGND